MLHHVHRPELVVAELARVTRRGGRILLVDQLGDVDPMRSLELDRFERARDPAHARLLPDADIRGYLEANDLVVSANEIVRERRDMETYLDLVGLEGEERERRPDGAGGARDRGGVVRRAQGVSVRLTGAYPLVTLTQRR